MRLHLNGDWDDFLKFKLAVYFCFDGYISWKEAAHQIIRGSFWFEVLSRDVQDQMTKIIAVIAGKGMTVLPLWSWGRFRKGDIR